jgi:hypothetical protein
MILSKMTLSKGTLGITQHNDIQHDRNVCREKGLLLSFVYKFGWVARRCC